MAHSSVDKLTCQTETMSPEFIAIIALGVSLAGLAYHRDDLLRIFGRFATEPFEQLAVPTELQRTVFESLQVKLAVPNRLIDFGRNFQGNNRLLSTTSITSA